MESRCKYQSLSLSLSLIQHSLVVDGITLRRLGLLVKSITRVHVSHISRPIHVNCNSQKDALAPWHAPKVSDYLSNESSAMSEESRMCVCQRERDFRLLQFVPSPASRLNGSTPCTPLLAPLADQKKPQVSSPDVSHCSCDA